MLSDQRYILLQVFFVDYGNMASVLDIHVRNLKPEYLILPFHAYECFLPDLHHSPGYVSRQHHARSVDTSCVECVHHVTSHDYHGYCTGVQLACAWASGLAIIIVRHIFHSYINSNVA